MVHVSTSFVCRGRDEEEEEEEEEAEVRQASKSAKRDVFEFRSQPSTEAPLVKKEKVTPLKQVPVEEPREMRSRGGLRSRSKSKSPSPGPTTRVTKDGRSTSPVPQSSKNQQGKRQRSLSPAGSVSPVRQRDRGRKRNSPAPSPTRGSPEVKQETVADPFDDLDSHRPSKKRLTRANLWDSEGEDEEQNSDHDPFADEKYSRSSAKSSRGKTAAVLKTVKQQRVVEEVEDEVAEDTKSTRGKTAGVSKTVKQRRVVEEVEDELMEDVPNPIKRSLVTPNRRDAERVRGLLLFA